MHGLYRSHLQVRRLIRKLRGGSQPILVEGADGREYVLKFMNNPQGTNLPFNESIGTELFRACRLPVPSWKPIVLTRDFVDKTPECWMETAGGRVRPEPGICFGSLFLGGSNIRLLELLPGSFFAHVQCRSNFWLAWILDVCCQHADHRQALFVEDSKRRLWPWFIDMGHMFNGPTGELKLSDTIRCRYSDPRVYTRIKPEGISKILGTIQKLDVDALWRVAKALPEDWISRNALLTFSEALNMLAKVDAVQECLCLRVFQNSQISEGQFVISTIPGLLDTIPGQRPNLTSVYLGKPSALPV